jgi:amidase
MTELWKRSALDLAQLIASGEASSREVVDAHLARIAAVNGELNAITVEMGEQARAEADAADADRDHRGPLHGVPFTIKENVDLVGYPTTNGLAAFADALPSEDAVTVARLKAAGAIPIGRTNMPEFGLRVSTENRFRGLTRNPWNHDLTAGGSSGGEGSAIASGMSPLGIGNDIGGSIRNPALCCGVAGMKPGYGRIPRVASLPPQDPTLAAQLMAVEGPLARTVADLRLATELLIGRSPRDPRVADVPLVGPPTAKRAGIVRSVPFTEIDPAALAAVDTAAEALVAAGWEVVDVEPPELEKIAVLWRNILAFDFAAGLPVFEQVMSDDEVRLLRALVDEAASDGMAPQTVFMERMAVQRQWAEMFTTTPVVVGPGWTRPPFAHGEDVVPGQETALLESRLGFVVPGNTLGLPVLAMTTTVVDGLPAGVQVYADHWREDLCLEAGAAIEGACGVVTPIDPVW